MLSIETILNAFATMFVTIDPIAGVPFLLAVTPGMSREQRHKIAIRASIAAAAILILSSSLGLAILKYLGVSISAFNVAGGLLLLLTGFEMIYGSQKRQRQGPEDVADEAYHDVALFPLAFPLMAGPGSISATILLSQNMSDMPSRFILLCIILVCVLIMYLMFILAERIDSHISQRGQITFTRCLGLLLMALSVQYIADGIKGLAIFTP